jgi:predicted PurR-regulated permease PerM
MSSLFDSSPPTSERASVMLWLSRFLIIVTILGVFALIGIVLWLLAQIAEPIVFMLLSIVLAYVLYPLVKILQHVMPRIVAILLVYLGVLLALSAFGYYIVVTAIGQLTSLIQTVQTEAPRLLQYVQPAQNALNRIGITSTQIASSVQQIGNQVLAIIGSLPSLVTTFFTVVIDAIIVTSLSIYFLIDGPRILKWIRSNTPVRESDNVTFFMGTVNRMMGGFLRGQITLSAVMSIIIGVGLFIIGVPYALLLAVIVFVLEFVPQIGAYISGAIIILFALLLRGWQTALIVLVFSSIAQGILDGQILAPRILGQAVGLHPIVSIFALLVGSKLFGIVGAVFSAPLAGLIQVLIVAYWTSWRTQHAKEFAQEAPIDQIPPPPALHSKKETEDPVQHE